jgi:hypothetical protein
MGRPLHPPAHKPLPAGHIRGAETRLVLSRGDSVDLVRVFIPERSNEARLVDRIQTHVSRAAGLGILRRPKPGRGAAAAPASCEVRRILEAFVDAQWLAEFDARLARYRERLQQAGDAAGIEGT